VVRMKGSLPGVPAAVPSACPSCSPGAASFKLAPLTSSSSLACVSRRGTLPALETSPSPTPVPSLFHLFHGLTCTHPNPLSTSCVLCGLVSCQGQTEVIIRDLGPNGDLRDSTIHRLNRPIAQTGQ
ncbi:hypothetical protein KUCAC02_001521, partial [Chaenocephalus aceratus]